MILIIGPAHAGKSTLAAALAKATGLPWGDTSQPIRLLAATMGLPCDRPTLVKLGRDLKALFGQDCLVNATLRLARAESGCAIVAGVRGAAELDAIQSRTDYVLYVERPGHDGDPQDSLELTPADADRVIVNSGPREDLPALAHVLAWDLGYGGAK